MKKFFSTTLVIAFFALMCVPAFALAQSGGTQNPPPVGSGGSSGGTQNPPPTSGGNNGTNNSNTITWKVTNPLKVEGGISAVIEAVMKNIVMPLASILVVLAILYSGFKFVIAQGNPKEIQEARQGLIWVLVGSLILLGAYGISAAIKDTVQQIVPLP